jgi:hypothetical protein
MIPSFLEAENDAGLVHWYKLCGEDDFDLEPSAHRLNVAGDVHIGALLQARDCALVDLKNPGLIDLGQAAGAR